MEYTTSIVYNGTILENMKWNLPYAYGVCSLCVIINILAIVFLLRTKKLRKSRFHSLLLFLSISDSTIGFQFLINAVLKSLNIETHEYLYACMILKHSVGGTLGFSQFQTLMICLERLQATFSQEVKILRRLTSNLTVGISFVVLQLYTFIPCFIELSYGPQPCQPEYTIRPLYVLTLDIPFTISACLMIGFYIAIMVRLRRLENKVHVIPNVRQLTKNKARMARMRSNIVTLGIVIAVTTIAIIPRELIVIYSSLVDTSESVLSLVNIANHLTLVNPLIDPFIYILRIKEVRDVFKNKCCKRSSVKTDKKPATSIRKPYIKRIRVQPTPSTNSKSDGSSIFHLS